MMIMHDRAPGDVAAHVGTVAGVDCVRDLPGGGAVHVMYIQTAIDAGAVACPRCMPRPDAIAYDIRVQYVRKQEPVTTPDDGSTTHYVAHIKVERVVKQRAVFNLGKVPTGTRDVTEVGQMTVRATSLTALTERISQAAAVVCHEDGS